MVKEKDPEALTRAIEELVNNREMAKEIGKKGRNKVEREFNIDRISRLLINLFMENTPDSKGE